jgi:hypothetical protein
MTRSGRREAARTAEVRKVQNDCEIDSFRISPFELTH